MIKSNSYGENRVQSAIFVLSPIFLYPGSGFFEKACRPILIFCVTSLKQEMDDTKTSGFERDDLIISFLSGNGPAPDQDILLDWVNQSEENRAYFLKMQSIWLGTGQSSGVDMVNTEKALLKIQQATGTGTRETSKRSFSLVSRISGIAAAFLMMFLLGGLASYYLVGDRGDDTTIASVYAPKGSKAQTVLPDGSEVWLNAGSKLSYNNTSYFRKNREVRLAGEAYFQVVTDRDRPFVVKVNGLDIKALGTEFNVKAYPEEKIVETTLVKGIVKIEGSDLEKRIIDITLTPRQKAICYTEGGFRVSTEQSEQAISAGETGEDTEWDDHPPVKVSRAVITSNVKTDLYTSWRDNRWIIEGMDIGQLSVLIERKYNVSIEFASAELKDYKFTGTFQDETLEQVMQVLKLTAPLNYEIGKGRVELTMDPLLKDKYEKFLN